MKIEIRLLKIVWNDGLREMLKLNFNVLSVFHYSYEKYIILVTIKFERNIYHPEKRQNEKYIMKKKPCKIEN